MALEWKLKLSFLNVLFFETLTQLFIFFFISENEEYLYVRIFNLSYKFNVIYVKRNHHEGNPLLAATND